MNSNAIITIQHSRCLAIYLWVLIAFACCCTLYAIPFLLALFVLPCIVLYGRTLLCQHAWRNSENAILQLEHHKGYRWVLRDRSQQYWQATYKGSAFRSPWLIIAHFAVGTNKRNFTVVIAKDAVDTQYYTNLLMKLWI